MDVSSEVERAQTRAIASGNATARLKDTAGSLLPPPARLPPRSLPPSAATAAAAKTAPAGLVPNGVASSGEYARSGSDGARNHQARHSNGAGDTREDGRHSSSNGSAIGGGRLRGQHQQQQQQEEQQPQQPEQDGREPLTEPFVAWCVSRGIDAAGGLFLSSSMPCRDVDAFADSGWADDIVGGRGRGVSSVDRRANEGNDTFDGGGRLSDVASNRGASGIDGVISSAMGCVLLQAELTKKYARLFHVLAVSANSQNAFCNVRPAEVVQLTSTRSEARIKRVGSCLVETCLPGPPTDNAVMARYMASSLPL